ncbi:MAG: PilN domain-containing protein [Planctomycetota bacterium]
MTDSADPKSGFAGLVDRLKNAGGKKTDAGLDFLPDDYAENRARRRADVLLLTLFGVTVCAIGGTWHLCEKELAEAESEYAQVDARYADATRRIEQVKQMRQRQKSVADRMELSASLLEKMPRSNLMAEITNTLPHGVVLAKAGLEAKQIKAAPPPAPAKKTRRAKKAPAPRPQPLRYDTTLSLEGTSLTEGQVSDYIDALNRGGYFDSVDLMWVRQEDKRTNDSVDLRRFLIALKLDDSVEPRQQILGESDLAAGDQGGI